MFRRVAIMEMGHVEQLAERILFLKGDVNMVAAGPIEQITDAEKIVERGADIEHEAVGMYDKYALECSAKADALDAPSSRALVEPGGQSGLAHPG